MSIKPKYRFINNFITLGLPNAVIIQEFILLNQLILLLTF